MDKKKLEALQRATRTRLLGTPEENQEHLIKTLLADEKLHCTNCNFTYQTVKDFQMFRYKTRSPINEPNHLLLKIMCQCGHSGSFDFKPNPLVHI